jgi:hypothetical protein
MVAPQSQFESKYQALHSFGATFWRASTGWTGGTFVSYDVGDLGLPTLISSINERIDVGLATAVRPSGSAKPRASRCYRLAC